MPSLRLSKCCLKIGFWLGEDDPDFLRWLSFHKGVEIIRYPTMPGDVAVEIEAKCRHLRCVGFQKETGKYLYECEIYDERPQLCRDWPYRAEVVIPGCGFTFVGEGGR